MKPFEKLQFQVNAPGYVVPFAWAWPKTKLDKVPGPGLLQVRSRFKIARRSA